MADPPWLKLAGAPVCSNAVAAARSARPALVVSDIHLGRNPARDLASDLARLVRAHPEHELIVAGDAFDLSMEPASSPPLEAMVGLLGAHPTLVDALRRHVSGGSPLTLIAGNHDHEVGTATARTALGDRLGVISDAPLRTAPWMVRRGRVHIEHGHVYDPDNAPTHPLAQWTRMTEPLGISLTRRFLAPTGAGHFAHAHSTTPLEGFLDAFRQYGKRGPWIVYQWFATSIRVCAEAGPARRFDEERERGTSALGEAGRDVGELPFESLLHHAATPTHHSFEATFMRLYFDRVIAAVGLTAGAALAALFSRTLAAGIVGASGAYLLYSNLRQKDRYGARPTERLRAVAEDVAGVVDADVVVFGHTHREERGPRYLNSGSFAFSRREARPYAVLSPGGEAEARLLPRQL